MNPINKNSVSLAGEFAVLSQLALRGYDANMTLGHTKGVDILVHSPEKGRLYKLEVKTTFPSNRNNEPSVGKVHGKTIDGWMMSQKHESINDPALFYCFVSIPHGDGAFRFFIVPSKVVARYVAEEHELWLREKKKEGKKVKDTPMRLFRIGFKEEKYAISTPTVERYQNNWDFAV